MKIFAGKTSFSKKMKQSKIHSQKMIEVAPQFSFFTTPLFFGFERKKPYNNLESVSQKLSSTVTFKHTNLHTQFMYVIMGEMREGKNDCLKYFLEGHPSPCLLQKSFGRALWVFHHCMKCLWGKTLSELVVNTARGVTVYAKNGNSSIVKVVFHLGTTIHNAQQIIHLGDEDLTTQVVLLLGGANTFAPKCIGRHKCVIFLKTHFNSNRK